MERCLANKKCCSLKNVKMSIGMLVFIKISWVSLYLQLDMESTEDKTRGSCLDVFCKWVFRMIILLLMVMWGGHWYVWRNPSQTSLGKGVTYMPRTVHRILQWLGIKPSMNLWLFVMGSDVEICWSCSILLPAPRWKDPGVVVHIYSLVLCWWPTGV